MWKKQLLIYGLWTNPALCLRQIKYILLGQKVKEIMGCETFKDDKRCKQIKEVITLDD